MPRIKDDSVEKVKAAMEIVPLVEDTVRLRKSGGGYSGLWDGTSGWNVYVTVTTVTAFVTSR